MLIKTKNIKSYKLTQIQPILDIIPKNVVLAGGALKSVLDFKPVSDFDFFILSNNIPELVLRKADLETFLKSEGFIQIFQCPAGELSTFKKGHLKVQVINVGHTVYKTPESIIDRFDFNLCRMFYYMGYFYYDLSAIKDLKTKTLSLNQLYYPASTINRLTKYKNQGYNTHFVSVEIVEKIMDNITDNVFMNHSVIYVD